jgi:hypothetical protein
VKRPRSPVRRIAGRREQAAARPLIRFRGHQILAFGGTAQSGRSQVYLQAFPGPGERVQASTDGGREPVWAPNGSELYFRTPTKFMAVDVKARPALTVGKPRPLFGSDFLLSHHDYGLLPDGRHFIMIQPVEGKQTLAELHVVVNWPDELKQRLAAARN